MGLLTTNDGIEYNFKVPLDIRRMYGDGRVSKLDASNPIRSPFVHFD